MTMDSGFVPIFVLLYFENKNFIYIFVARYRYKYEFNSKIRI